MEVIINGRFLTGPLTGVQRTACEMVKALDRLIDEGLIDNNRLSFRIIYPGKQVIPLDLKHIPIISKGMLNGNLWEQLELPLYSAGRMLLNLCSIAPLLKRRQMVFIHDASVFVNKAFSPPHSDYGIVLRSHCWAKYVAEYYRIQFL